MIGALNGIADLWWSWMGPMLWQVSLLIIVIGAIDRLIRSWAWPEVRHALWLLILVKLLIPPGWSFPGAVFPRLVEPLSQSIGERWPAAETAERLFTEPNGRSTTTLGGSAAAGAPFGEHTLNTNPPTQLATNRSPRPVWQVYAFGIWVLGMAAVISLLVIRMKRLRKWHREQEEKRTIPPWFLDLMVATAKRLKLERLPAIVFSDEVASPAVYGVFHPVLLLPARSADLSREEAEHVLMHELAHLKRGDLWWHGLLLLLQIVYWFNPLLMWARRQIKHVRELCCDLTVASHLREKTMEYRKTLLDTARRLLTESNEPALALLGVFEEPFRLVARLRWLEKETWRRRTPALFTAGFVLVIGVPLLLPMASADDTGSLDGNSKIASNEPWPRHDADSSPARRNTQAVYIRNEFVAQDLVVGFATQTELIAIAETWIGDDIIATTERGKTVIINRRENRITYVDHKHQFWMETSLPIDVTRDLGDHSLKRRHERRSSGEVTETRRTRRILKRKCREYHVHSWYAGNGRIHTEENIKVWASTDMPFDLSLYDDLLYNLRVIYNRDDLYRSELEKIRGFQMGIEMRAGNFFLGKRYADETVRIETRTPPPGIFEPPVGYERREKIEDLEF